MSQKNIRLGLSFLFLTIGVLLHIKQGIGSAWYLYAAALILLLTHFLFGNVWAAFAKLKAGQLEEAEQMVRQIKRPNLLLKTHKSYYHFIKGIAALHRKDWKVAELHLNDALNLGLRNANDRTLVMLNMVHLFLAQQQYDKARLFISQLKTIPHNDPTLQTKINELEKALST